MVRFGLNIGSANGANKVELADFIARTARVNDIVIGHIEIGQNQTTIEVHKDVGLKVLRALRQSSYRGKRLMVTPMPRKR
jgi:ATP-dependent RNA helicase DeaD